MAFNLLELTKSAINKHTTAQMAGLLDLDEKSTGQAISLALQALVGGLINKAQSPAGASELFELVEQHDGSMLGNLGELFTGGKHTMLIEMGQKILQSIFGNKLTSIVGTIGKLTGLDSAKANSLPGMLAPILISVLGKQKKTSGWDVTKFSSALMSQKELLPTMDPGLTKAPGMKNLPGAGKKTVASSGRVVAGGMDRAKATAGHTAQAGGSLLKIVVPLLAVVALAFLAWKFLLAPPAPNAGPGAPKTNQLPGTGGSGLVGDLDSGNVLGQVRDLFGNVMTTIESVKDEATATSAATRLKVLSDKVDALGLGKLDGLANTGVSVAVKAFRPKLEEILANVYKIPGVEAILKPAGESFLNKFN